MLNKSLQAKLKIAIVGCTFILFISAAAMAQSVSGTVRSASDNQPLPGVTVHVGNSSQGTITNNRGYYQLSDVSPNDTLVFSFVGFQQHTEIIGNNTAINVELDPIASKLDQLVVIGYGTAKKKDLTGSVSTVSMDEKRNEANVNISQALVGEIPGLNMEQRGGAASNPTMLIRGRTSFSGSEAPLIVLDGAIFYGSISDINPSDVESIDILKGASAAAVYGRRAANGVVIITTKKGQIGKPLISLHMYTGIQKMTNNPVRVMNGQEMAEKLLDYRWQLEVNDWYDTHPTSDKGRPERPDVSNRQLVSTYFLTHEESNNYLNGEPINWVDHVLRNSPVMQNYGLSVSGGTDNGVRYYLSGSYSHVQGIQKNDQFGRATIHSNLSDEITDWLKVELNTSYTYRDNSGLPLSLAAARVASPWVDNKIGKKNHDIYLAGELYQPNPMNNMHVNNSDITTQLYNIGSIQLKAPWIKGLKYTLRYSRLQSQRENNSFYPSLTTQGFNFDGEAVKNPSKNISWIFDNIINYSGDFGDHRINATFLFSREKRFGESTTAKTQKIGIQSLGYDNLGLGQIPTVSSSAYEENSISYMGRVNYSYKSKYLITGTIRHDGYSGFSPNHKWADFPSVAIAWVPTNESFLYDEGFYLKIRLGYGLNGNQGVGRYASFSQMSGRDYVYDGQTAIGIYPSVLGNQNLEWEKTKSLNLGFDFHFLQNRLSGSLSLYNSNTNSVLVKRKLPSNTGYGSVWANLGKINNKGVELELNSINFKGEFSWETKFVFSLNRNKILKLYGNGVKEDIGNAWFVGEPIEAIYDYKILGVWTEQDLFDGKMYPDWYPGLYKIDDLNKNGKIDPGDRQIIGYASPSYRFGINNRLSYKNFTFSIFINSIQGGKNHFIANNRLFVNHPWQFTFRKNTSAINPYWRPDRETQNTTQLAAVPPTTGIGVYQDRSFVSIQNVSLSYSLSQKIIDSWGLQSAQIYVSSKNPYVFTKWQGWSPEIGPTDTPLLRNIILGLRVSF